MKFYVFFGARGLSFLYTHTHTHTVHLSRHILSISFPNQNGSNHFHHQGAGKTTVISPLVCLLLADGEHLVTQVVPSALLEFSRSVLRSTFSSIMPKRVYTFAFERSSAIDGVLYKKLENARKHAAVVVTTPSSVKSLLLKFIESVFRANDPGDKQQRETAKEVKEALRIFQLLRNGVTLMDEVDVVLHPLKSELNFPVGRKEDLDYSPERWELPIHILDAIFAATQGAEPQTKGEQAEGILKRLRTTINDGYKKSFLQRSPHMVLLSEEFYMRDLKPILGEWTVLWLLRQGFDLTKVTQQRLLKYILGSRREEAAIVADLDDPNAMKALNLCCDWLNSFLPHVLQKIDRVTFGVMNKLDLKLAFEADPNMPRSRAKLAIPFIGKDVPSPSSVRFCGCGCAVFVSVCAACA